MSRLTSLLEFIDGLAIHRGVYGDVHMYIRSIMDGDMRIRDVNETDTRKIGIEVLYLDVRGRGKNRSLSGIYQTTADIDKVTKKFVSCYVHMDDGEGRVLHLKKDSPILSVIK